MLTLGLAELFDMFEHAVLLYAEQQSGDEGSDDAFALDQFAAPIC